MHRLKSTNEMKRAGQRRVANEEFFWRDIDRHSTPFAVMWRQKWL